MISKKYYQELLSDTPFKRDYNKTIQDFYSYIIDSEINGAISQVREFVNKLSKGQFKDFLIYCNFESIKTDFLKYREGF